jgi:undecaprenyl-diphosphatase
VSNPPLARSTRALRWLTRDGIHYLLGFLALAGSLWVFAEVADEVVEGESQRLDRAVLEALRQPGDLSDPLGPPWVEEAMRDITALGGTAVLTLITLFAVGFLVLERKPKTIAFLVLSVIGGLLLSLLLKDLFDRPRPDFLAHAQVVYTKSFPSGHSMNAAVIYLTLGATLAHAHEARALKVYMIAASIAVTVLVGFSRLYLGVHWPTDVLAGWSAGAAWGMLVWLSFRLLQHGHVVEPQATGQEQTADGGPQADPGSVRSHRQ